MNRIPATRLPKSLDAYEDKEFEMGEWKEQSEARDTFCFATTIIHRHMLIIKTPPGMFYRSIGFDATYSNDK